MSRETIGHFDCPLCGKPASVRKTAAGKRPGKPYIVCQDDECGFQGFARGEGAAQKLNAKMRPIAADVAAIDTGKAKPAAPAAAANPPAAPAKKKGFFDEIFPS